MKSPDSVTVSVPHRLGKAEAIRRLKQGFERTQGQLRLITIEEQAWEGDTLRFRMHALGQVAAGTIEVFDDMLRIDVALPWLLAKAAQRLIPVIRDGATSLLGKK